MLTIGIRSSECWFFPFSGRSYLILKLIKRGAVVNAMDYLGTTALHLACQRGQDNAAVSSGLLFSLKQLW